jgi:hypothetical protein
MASCAIPSRGRVGGIVPPAATAVGTATLVMGVVGFVRQVDSGAHPYPPPLLLGPVGMRGRLSSRSFQLGRLARARQSQVGALSRSRGIALAFDRVPVGDMGPGHSDQAIGRGYRPSRPGWSRCPYGWTLVLGTSLDWSAGSRPARDPVSLDPSEAPERLCICLIMKALSLLCYVFALSEKSHHIISAAGRHDI